MFDCIKPKMERSAYKAVLSPGTCSIVEQSRDVHLVWITGPSLPFRDESNEPTNIALSCSDLVYRSAGV